MFLHKFGFSIKKWVEMIENNSDNCGDENGDNGQNYDALIIYYYLMQKYDDKKIKLIANKINDFAIRGVDITIKEIMEKLGNC